MSRDQKDHDMDDGASKRRERPRHDPPITPSAGTHALAVTQSGVPQPQVVTAMLDPSIQALLLSLATSAANRPVHPVQPYGAPPPSLEGEGQLDRLREQIQRLHESVEYRDEELRRKDEEIRRLNC